MIIPSMVYDWIICLIVIPGATQESGPLPGLVSPSLTDPVDMVQVHTPHGIMM